MSLRIRMKKFDFSFFINLSSNRNMIEPEESCKLCDNCKQPFVTTNTHVVCTTCKARFCNSKCKKNARKDHKKCINRPHFKQSESITKPGDDLIIVNSRIRALLFGDNDMYKCGFYDKDMILQPGTTEGRAIELVATHYQRLRSTYIAYVPIDASYRSIGVLHLHFDDFYDLAQTYICNESKHPTWIPLSEAMMENVKKLELGRDYFGLFFTIGPKDGPYVMNQIVRFLYKSMIE